MGLFDKKKPEKPTKPIRDAKGRFPKGVSGNPYGKPKVGDSLTEKYRSAWSEPLDPNKPEYKKGDAIIDAVMLKALKGDMTAITYLEARGFGKLLDRVQITPPRQFDLSKLTDAELEELERLQSKLQEQDEH